MHRYVQLYNVGQVGTDRAAVYVKYVRSSNPGNAIVGCAFVDTFNTGVSLQNAKGVLLDQNVFYNTMRSTVVIDSTVRVDIVSLGYGLQCCSSSAFDISVIVLESLLFLDGDASLLLFAPPDSPHSCHTNRPIPDSLWQRE